MRHEPWGVFLDRDGTLVPDARHAVRPEQLKLYPTAGEGLRLLKGGGAKLLVVSNQSAVARGWLDSAGLARMDRRLRGLVAAEGARLHASYYCPHHPDFTGACRCRKPAPGLLEEGLRDHHLDPSRCFLVGDTLGDMEAGRRAGVSTVLVLTGHGRGAREAAIEKELVDHVTLHLTAAARWILGVREAWRSGNL